MFRGVLNLIIVFATVFALTGAVNAVFSGEVVNKSNSFTVGNSDLKIKTQADSPWSDNVLGAEINDIYPGWTLLQTFFIKNNSSSQIDLAVFPKIEINSYTNGSILENFYMEITNNSKTYSTGAYPLKFWLNNESVSIEPILEQKKELGPMSVIFSVPITAENSVKGSFVKFNLILNGQQINY